MDMSITGPQIVTLSRVLTAQELHMTCNKTLRSEDGIPQSMLSPCLDDLRFGIFEEFTGYIVFHHQKITTSFDFLSQEENYIVQISTRGLLVKI